MHSWATRLLDESPLISQTVDEAECVLCSGESLIRATQFRSVDWHKHAIRDVAHSTDNFHNRVKGTLTSGLLNRPSPKYKSNVLGALTTQVTNCLDRCQSPHLMSFVNSLAGANDSTHVDFITGHGIMKRSQQDPPTCYAVIQAHSGADAIVQHYELNRHSRVFNDHSQPPVIRCLKSIIRTPEGDVRHG